MNAPPHRVGCFELLTCGSGLSTVFTIREWRNDSVFEEIGSLNVENILDLQYVVERALRKVDQEDNEYRRRKK